MGGGFRSGADRRAGARRRLGFGAMRLPGMPGRHPVDHTTAVAVARRAVELGVAHIDTAAFYTRGSSSANEILRRALRPYPDGLTVATKVGPGQDVRAAVEQNLGELGLDALDLVYVQAGRPGEALAERFARLAELRAKGLVRNLGVADVTRAQFDEARTVAPVSAVQNRFGVLDQSDASLVDECARAGVTYVAHSSLGGGRIRFTDDGLRRVALRHGATVYQVALAWGLARSPTLVQIPGTASLTHLEQNMAALRLELDDHDMATLERLA
ncbi:aldo/keto reductase [Actinomadura rupiterrae]|uniref:aldo/keto reductase n=1 Tax=Actinomadura rupiterrae TaxID=559627 RepID=UPI0020A422BA|nr:aldo/keto reductase [Actinomadura rupiterrae]MCP2335841.1 aryl-alcohol dehydrogenase-like predicted oxidoreductase [Actinomadura rupiterrae]